VNLEAGCIFSCVPPFFAQPSGASFNVLTLIYILNDYPSNLAFRVEKSDAANLSATAQHAAEKK